MAVLRFDHVSKQYPGGRAALSEVSFEVAAGEMLFLTGHSGAGKSTLLKLIHLAERPSRGTVLFNDRNLLKVRGRRVALHRREVGVVFQDHCLLTDRSVFDNVALPLVLRGLRRGEIGRRVRGVLERLGLGDRERALPAQLSAGEQQRVGNARAVYGEPRLLVADEPTGNHDPPRRSWCSPLPSAAPACWWPRPGGPAHAQAGAGAHGRLVDIRRRNWPMAPRAAAPLRPRAGTWFDHHGTAWWPAGARASRGGA